LARGLAAVNFKLIKDNYFLAHFLAPDIPLSWFGGETMEGLRPKTKYALFHFTRELRRKKGIQEGLVALQSL